MQNNLNGIAAAVAVAAIFTVGACGDSTVDTQATTTTSVATSSPPSSPSAQAHNDTDVTFAQQMIPHHQQAIEMSDILLAKQGIDPRVVSLANEIKAAQGPEIEQMQTWLDEWGAPTGSMPRHDMPPHDMPRHDMPDHDMGGGDMPGMSGGHGMMSAQDIAALQDAQGAEASRLFLTQMIEHHQGAITMAQTEIQQGQFPAAVEMARTIESSQQQEITTMQDILDSM